MSIATRFHSSFVCGWTKYARSRRRCLSWLGAPARLFADPATHFPSSALVQRPMSQRFAFPHSLRRGKLPSCFLSYCPRIQIYNHLPGGLGASCTLPCQSPFVGFYCDAHAFLLRTASGVVILAQNDTRFLQAIASGLNFYRDRSGHGAFTDSRLFTLLRRS